MKRILKRLKYFLLSFFCEHQWKLKKFGCMDTPYFTSTERRCVKCKKIEYTHFNKLYNKSFDNPSS